MSSVVKTVRRLGLSASVGANINPEQIHRVVKRRVRAELKQRREEWQEKSYESYLSLAGDARVWFRRSNGFTLTPATRHESARLGGNVSSDMSALVEDGWKFA